MTNDVNVKDKFKIKYGTDNPKGTRADTFHNNTNEIFREIKMYQSIPYKNLLKLIIRLFNSILIAQKPFVPFILLSL